MGQKVNPHIFGGYHQELHSRWLARDDVFGDTLVRLPAA